MAAISAAALNIGAGDPDEARRHLLECDPGLRGWEWRHLMYRADPSLGVWQAGGSFPAEFYPSSFGMRDGRLVWHTRSSIEEWSPGGVEHISEENVGHVLSVNASGTRAACRGGSGNLVVYALDRFGAIADLSARGRVESAAFDLSAARVAAGTADGVLQIWDLARQRLLVQWQAHEGPVSSVIWFPDNRRIASVGPDRHVHVWDSASGAMLATPEEYASQEWRLAVSPSSKWISFPSRESSLPGQDVRVRINWLNGQSVDRSYPSQGNVGAIAFNAAVANGSQYGFVNHSGELQFCDEANGCTILRRHTHDRLNSLTFVGDGAVAYTGSASGEVVAWDANTRGGNVLPVPGSNTAVSLDPAGTRLIAATEDNSVCIWSAFNGSHVSTWGQPEKSRISALSFSPDGTHAASATAQGLVRLWDASGHLLRTLPGHSSAVTALQFSPDGALLAASAADGTVRLWNVPAGNEAGVLRHGAQVNALAFHPNGSALVTGSADRAAPVRIWDLNSKTAIRSFSLDGEAAAAILIAPDGETLLAGSNPGGKIAVWSLPGGRRVATMAGHSAAVRAIALHPDGSRLVSGSDDKTLRIWETGAWKELLVLRGHPYPVRFVTFASGGARIISSCRGVRLWNTREGARWPSRVAGAL